MDEIVEKCLYDILECIDAIELYLGEKRNFFDYLNSRLLRRAIEREMEIVGEAMNRILRINPDIAISNKRRIVGMRNVIAHDYDRIQSELIWAIIVNDLPTLKTEVEQLLKHT